ncbi:unnamed protein product [Peniophora sp. CBMAI 1063]|nr:unnamed protein product [Peniophora sp. CBMAI 1063]
MYTSFSTLSVFVLAAAQFSPSLAAPISSSAGTIQARVSARGSFLESDFVFAPPASLGSIPTGQESRGDLFGRDGATLPGGSGSGVTIIGRQLPDSILSGGNKELPGDLKSNGIIFKRDDDDDGERLQDGNHSSGMVYGRTDIGQRFVCGGDTGLECPTTTVSTTAPGLPVPFRELDTREEAVKARNGFFGEPQHITPPIGLQHGGEAAGALFRRDANKRIVCNTTAGVDCSDLPSPSSVPDFPPSVRILKAREITNIDGKRVGVPTTGLPFGDEGPGAVSLGKPANEPRELFNKAGGMFGSGFLGGHDNEPSTTGQSIDDSNTQLSARDGSDIARRALRDASEGALWGPAARGEHQSRALDNGQIRAP